MRKSAAGSSWSSMPSPTTRARRRSRRSSRSVIWKSMATFTLSVLTDEISQDFGHACEVASREFGLSYVELRAMHGKNIMSWDANDVAEARSVLERLKLRVSEMGPP